MTYRPSEPGGLRGRLATLGLKPRSAPNHWGFGALLNMGGTASPHPYAHTYMCVLSYV